MNRVTVTVQLEIEGAETFASFVVETKPKAGWRAVAKAIGKAAEGAMRHPVIGATFAELDLEAARVLLANTKANLAKSEADEPDPAKRAAYGKQAKGIIRSRDLVDLERRVGFPTRPGRDVDPLEALVKGGL